MIWLSIDGLRLTPRAPSPKPFQQLKMIECKCCVQQNYAPQVPLLQSHVGISRCKQAWGRHRSRQGRTLIFVHLVLAAERKRCPSLTLRELWLEKAANPNCKEIDVKQPEERCGEGESKTFVCSVPVDATLDGVDMRFDACVVMDLFRPDICLGPQELKCYNINRQEPTGEARIDERASLVVSFRMPEAAPILLRGLVDTGSGLCIL